VPGAPASTLEYCIPEQARHVGCIDDLSSSNHDEWEVMKNEESIDVIARLIARRRAGGL
jgi:hypothetical protein